MKTISKYIKLTLGTVCTTVLMYSCGKQKFPEVKIVSPANGQVFIAPQVVNVTANLYDDGDALAWESLFVIKENTAHDTVVNLAQYKFLFGKYVIEKSFTTEPNTTYKIIAGAWGGHGNFKYDSIIIKAN